MRKSESIDTPCAIVMRAVALYPSKLLPCRPVPLTLWTYQSSLTPRGAPGSKQMRKGGLRGPDVRKAHSHNT